MESAKLNALPYRSTRYHSTHLRPNTRISDITPPRTETSQYRTLRFRMLMCNARAKKTPTQVVEISGRRGHGAIEATSAARIRAFRHFLSEDETEQTPAAGNSGTDEIAVETHIVILAMMYLPAFSDFLVFRLTCVGPVSATVCAGSA